MHFNVNFWIKEHKITDKMSVFHLDFSQFNDITCYNIIKQTMRDSLHIIYNLDKEMIDMIEEFSMKQKELNENMFESEWYYKQKYLMLNEYKEIVNDFLPYEITITDYETHYVHTIWKVIDDIQEKKIEEWNRRHVYYTWKRNCLQHIQLQKNENTHDLNFVFRSQSWKCFWMDLIQFILPILESIFNNWWKVWNITLTINNLHV